MTIMVISADKFYGHSEPSSFPTQKQKTPSICSPAVSRKPLTVNDRLTFDYNSHNNKSAKRKPLLIYKEESTRHKSPVGSVQSPAVSSRPKAVLKPTNNNNDIRNYFQHGKSPSDRDSTLNGDQTYSNCPNDDLFLFETPPKKLPENYRPMLAYASSSSTNTTLLTTTISRVSKTPVKKDAHFLNYTDEDGVVNIVEKNDYSPFCFDTPPKNGEGKLEGIPSSLKNFANNCYMNSVVQSLFSFKFFMDAFVKCYQQIKDLYSASDQTMDIKAKLPIMSRLIDMHDNYQSSSQIEKILREFKEYCGEHIDKRFGTEFGKNEQQDAGEFFSIILDALREEITANIPKECKSIQNPVVHFFQFILTQTNVCPKCHRNVLPAPGEPGSETSTVFYLSLTSDRALQSAFLNKVRTEDPQPYCPDCKIPCTSTKKFDKLPKVLVFQALRYSNMLDKDSKEIFASNSIYLPREYINTPSLISPIATPYKSSLKRSTEFINSEKKAFVKKLKFDDDIQHDAVLSQQDGVLVNANVLPDENSIENKQDQTNPSVNSTGGDLSSASASAAAVSVSATSPIDKTKCERYQLVSIICHISDSIGLGHYVSYVFNFQHSKWFHCNDQKIREVSYAKLMEDTSKSSLCYFYVHTED